MLTRLEIEQAILGAIIFCNGYSQVAHILSVQNFSSTIDGDRRHKELYGIIADLYPNRPIDFISVAHEINRIYPSDPGVYNTLKKTGEIQVHRASSIVYWSFILLQLDITEKFRDDLVKWYSARTANMEHVEAGALKEIIETLNPEADIFTIVDGAKDYFKHLHMDDELEQTTTFYYNIIQKVQNIKTLNSIDIALGYLFRLCESAPDVRNECQAFASAIADMINTNTTKKKYEEAAYHITKVDEL